VAQGELPRWGQQFTHVHAVLLDMDGALVDSDAAVERAWRE
jgi:phosphoglycolate phosphatase-like HAD superfamily hydrolase